MSTVDPAAMWAYATAPISEPTSEPHRDPDGPLHAVLAAANAVAPRCRLEEGTALVHARYEYPSGLPDRIGEAEGRVTERVTRTWAEHAGAPSATDELKAATARYRDAAQRMWDAVKPKVEDTQRDYLGVQ